MPIGARASSREATAQVLADRLWRRAPDLNQAQFVGCVKRLTYARQISD
jgi:hypothetical protein